MGNNIREKNLWYAGKPYYNGMDDSFLPAETCCRVMFLIDENVYWADEGDTTDHFSIVKVVASNNYVYTSYNWVRDTNYYIKYGTEIRYAIYYNGYIYLFGYWRAGYEYPVIPDGDSGTIYSRGSLHIFKVDLIGNVITTWEVDRDEMVKNPAYEIWGGKGYRDGNVVYLNWQTRPASGNSSFNYNTFNLETETLESKHTFTPIPPPSYWWLLLNMIKVGNYLYSEVSQSGGTKMRIHRVDISNWTDTGLLTISDTSGNKTLLRVKNDKVYCLVTDSVTTNKTQIYEIDGVIVTKIFDVVLDSKYYKYTNSFNFYNHDKYVGILGYGSSKNKVYLIIYGLSGNFIKDLEVSKEIIQGTDNIILYENNWGIYCDYDVDDNSMLYFFQLFEVFSYQMSFIQFQRNLSIMI